MNESITEYIKEYLEEKISSNDYSYFISHKKMKGYTLVDRPCVDFKSCDITDYLKFTDKYNEVIENFYKKFKEVFSEEYLSLFNHNIKTLNIIDYKLKLFDKARFSIFNQANGSYDVYTNEVELMKKAKDDNEFKRIINHELLHLSSSVDLAFSGFSQEIITKNGTALIGNGLNEGYTEFLNKTYFSDTDDYSYHDQVQFASMIDNIVGRDFMIDCYFKKGLSPLIKQLGKKIGNNGKAIDLILSMDYVLGKVNYAFNKAKYIDVRFQLANFYIKELEDRYNSGEIDYDMYSKMRYLNVDRFIRGDDYYSENTVIEDTGKFINIVDGNKIKRVNKKDNNISFKLEEESGVIKM